jgi:hypothetical protein
MRFYFLFLILTLAGCAGDDGTSKPDDLIPADKMGAVLTEIHMAEAQVGRYALRSSDSTKLVFDRLNMQILKKFAVDTSAYRLSYIYYSSHPDKLEAIYKDVTKTLEKMANPQTTSAVSGSATSGSVTSNSVSSGSLTSGSATSGSATTGSALSGSATSVLATTNLGAAMKAMSGSATRGSSVSAAASKRAFLRRRK